MTGQVQRKGETDYPGVVMAAMRAVEFAKTQSMPKLRKDKFTVKNTQW